MQKRCSEETDAHRRATGDTRPAAAAVTHIHTHTRRRRQRHTHPQTLQCCCRCAQQEKSRAQKTVPVAVSLRLQRLSPEKRWISHDTLTLLSLSLRVFAGESERRQNVLCIKMRILRSPLVSRQPTALYTFDHSTHASLCTSSPSCVCE